MCVYKFPQLRVPSQNFNSLPEDYDIDGDEDDFYHLIARPPRTGEERIFQVHKRDAIVEK